MEYTLNQSAWRRGWNETKIIWTSWQFYVLDAVVAALIGGVFKWYWGLGVVLFGMLCVWIGAMAAAPVKQRDEARRALKNLSQTPLVVECNSFEYSFTGKNWLQENMYIWYFNVILTNNSDKDNIGTKAISLLVNYSMPDGKVKSYILSLVPETDRDKYGRPSTARGRLLVENEYLRPHESLTGYYQFLDAEAFWKPKLIQTWPTLVVVDTFDAPHRREFKGTRFTVQSNSDKEDSQIK